MDQNILKRLIEQEFELRVELELRFHPTRRWRFDLAIPTHMIAIELEGGVYTKGRHTRGSGFLKDMEKYNEAAKLGWKLLRYAHVKHNYGDVLNDLKEIKK